MSYRKVMPCWQLVLRRGCRTYGTKTIISIFFLPIFNPYGIDLNHFFSPSLRQAGERVVERSEDRVSNYASGINVNAWRTVDSPRMRCAVRPSLRQAGKRVKIFPIFYQHLIPTGCVYTMLRRSIMSVTQNINPNSLPCRGNTMS